MALSENRPVDRITISTYMADVSTASSAFAQSPVRGYIKNIRGELFNAITLANSAVTAKINGVAITGVAITVAFTGSAAGDSYSSAPTSNATSFVNPGDSIEIVTDGASTTAAPMMWHIEIDVV